MIAPKRVAETTWPAEIKSGEHLYGMTFAVAMGTARAEKGSSSVGSRCDDHRKGQCFLDDKKHIFDFDMVVIDELSSFKSPKAQRFKDLKK